MEENKAKTTESVANMYAFSDGANAGTVTSEHAASAENDSVNVSEFSDSGSGGDDKGSRTGKQSAEQNRENARRRREAEKEALIRRTREQTIIEALDGQNPYTGEEMKDSLDVEEYLAMKEIYKNGGDPVSD